MKCPKDNELLQHLSVKRNFLADIHLDICKQCQGVWVDGDELPQLTAHFSSDHQKTYKQWLTATTSGQTAPKDFWQEADHTCPKDGAVMRRHYIGAAHRVGVEQCPHCQGFWFDGSELYAVAEANESNPEFDRAVAGALGGLQSELSDNYQTKNIALWDAYDRPGSIIPHITNALSALVISYVSRM